MNRNQNGRNRNLASPVPGCLGRMVNLFDFNTSLGANRLLTDKPHYEGSPVSRCQSDLSTTRIVEDRMNDKMVLSELAKSPSNRKSNGTPIKMLIAQEMSKEEGPKQSPPNLVAKLMGLDTLPERHQLGSASSRSNPRRTRSHSGSLDFMQKEHGFLETREHDEMSQSCKDVFEIWQQSPQKGRCKESKNEKNMALIREKFMEAKRLSTDEKLRQSKQFQDALEVLSSNKDLLLKFFQEPNSLFSQHLNVQSLPPPPDLRRITVLRPSKLVDGHKLNKSGKQINGALQMGHCNSFDKSYKFNDNPKPTQPTRIVVLKPSSVKPHEMEIAPSPPSTSNDDGFFGDLEDTKESTHGISSGHRRDETLLSSVFSNGYIGDESSFSKSEVYYAAGNLSDSEVMSPISRHSWDYVNRFGSPYSSSSFSRASCSPESSVCREAKKRLSERWAMMSLNGSVQEQRHIRRSSSTLGEMLALSDLKKEEHCENREGSSSSNKVQDDVDSSPKTLVRSKSVPVSSASIMVEVSESLKVKKGDTKDLTKEKSVKSSLFKGLFFSKSRKSSKKSQKDDEHQSSRNIGDDGSECINNIDGSLRKESCHPADDIPEPETFGNPNENQDQPSPNSVLDLQIEDDDHTASCSYTAKLKEHGVDPMKFNLIDKSPPIGSISRTLSWDESSVGPGTPVPAKTLSPEEEEQEYFVYVQTLLSVTGINGSSPENPLDPSLRDTYMSLTGTDVMVHRSKQRHQRSTQRLVFDCVNEALSGAHVDQVWDRMKEWISGKERCVWEGDDEDGGSMAVERVVRREVVGRVWVEDLRLEIDDIKKEIEEKLVEELVEELTGRVILGYTL